MAGNKLGARVRIVYDSEQTGQIYILQTDADFAVAGAGAGASAPVIYDPANPPALTGNVSGRPNRFEPRGVYLKEVGGSARKFVVCTSPSAELYATATPTVVAIDGVDFITTGRRGESLSF